MKEFNLNEAKADKTVCIREMSKFIADYIKQYKCSSYETYAEQEDIADACKTAIQWANKTMVDKVCKWLEQNTKGVKFVCGDCHNAKEFISDIRNMMEEYIL